MTFNKRDIRNFMLAKEESKNSDFSPKVGCVVTIGKKVVARSCNGNKTDTLQYMYNCFPDNRDTPSKVHAEIAALKKLLFKNVDLSKASIYVYRQYADGRTAMARPCVACRRACMFYGIKRYYYTTEIGFCYERVT